MTIRSSFLIVRSKTFKRYNRIIPLYRNTIAEKKAFSRTFSLSRDHYFNSRFLCFSRADRFESGFSNFHSDERIPRATNFVSPRARQPLLPQFQFWNGHEIPRTPLFISRASRAPKAHARAFRRRFSLADKESYF